MESEKTIKLWLDDVRDPPAGYVWVKTAQEAIEYLKYCQYRGVTISVFGMDHDLEPEHYDPETRNKILPNTGFDVVLWMELYSYWPEVIIIHSWNPQGARRMCDVASKYTTAFIRRYGMI